MSGCTPRSAATITVPRIASSRLTAKQSSVAMNVTNPARTGMVYQRGGRDFEPSDTVANINHFRRVGKLTERTRARSRVDAYKIVSYVAGSSSYHTQSGRSGSAHARFPGGERDLLRLRRRSRGEFV